LTSVFTGASIIADLKGSIRMGTTGVDNHNRNVAKIQKEIAAAKGEIALKRAGTCCSRTFEYKIGKSLIDISALTHILEINAKEKYVIVEPLVTMEQLARATLAHQLTAPVVTEFRQMTIAGAIQGLAGESTSFKDGLIDESVMEYEAILADGSLVTITDGGDYHDLYHSLPGSYGSLAIVTKIKLRLKEATKYVRVVYQKLQSITEVQAEFLNSMQDGEDIDFIECIAVSKNDFRIARGYKTNHIPFKNYLFNRCSLKYFWSRWYCNHLIEKSVIDGYQEYLTYEDYLFRWDRGGFWLGLMLLEIMGHHKHTVLNRLFFGKMLKSQSLYKMLDRLPMQGREQSFVMQDLIVPGHVTEKFFHFLDNLVGIYPLWLLPIKPPKVKKIFSLPHNVDDMFVDFGVWGKQRNTKSIETNREIELFLQNHQGQKCLWSQSYLNQDEFWKVYDNEIYQSLRIKYKAQMKLINIYEKVTEYYRAVSA
jgi:delta24-sterol reductase